MTDKPKFGMYWTSGCGGCEVAELNIHEKILEGDEKF
jgi:F420-non-reducing hydrogenase small subunit